MRYKQAVIEYSFKHGVTNAAIRHKPIKPYTPKHNGKVERSHRKDNEEFYAIHKFYSFDDFKKQLAGRQRQYNNFPMRPLNWLPPKQVLFAFPNVSHIIDKPTSYAAGRLSRYPAKKSPRFYRQRPTKPGATMPGGCRLSAIGS